jgi:CarboxypepD_reg-like domain
MRSFYTSIYNLVFLIVAVWFFPSALFCQQGSVYLNGIVTEKFSGQSLPNVSVKLNNSTIGARTDNKGKFNLSLPKLTHFTLVIYALGFKKEIREVECNPEQDTININIRLITDSFALETVTIKANLQPDTVLSSPHYSIADFNFYGNNFILLTFRKNLEKASIRYREESGKEVDAVEIPSEAGEAKEIISDYMGYSNLLCKNKIYRIIIQHEKIFLAELNVKDFNSLVKPVIDTVDESIYFSNYSSDFPLFSYFNYNRKDSIDTNFVTIENKELMDLYRHEYYFLKPNEKLMARQIAQEYNIDKHRAAALMTGFTQSMFYTPLYAPLFVIGDTLHVFDHYKNYLFRFNKNGIKIDSVEIRYHHLKKWKEWKNRLIKDNTEESVYALFSKDGHQYLKRINTLSGKEDGTYKIMHYSAEKIKIRDNYLYYVYRPFESTQEKFLYREKIVLKK